MGFELFVVVVCAISHEKQKLKFSKMFSCFHKKVFETFSAARVNKKSYILFPILNNEILTKSKIASDLIL